MENKATNQLFAALAKAQLKFVPPVKSKKVDFTDKNGRRVKYGYADLADIVEVVKAPLGENDLSFTQMLNLDKELNQFGLTTMLMHSSGEYLTSWHPLPDPRERTIRPQEFGSFLTYARRYSLSALIGIVSEEDDDAQSAPAIEKKNSPQSQSPKPSSTPPPPSNSEEKKTGLVTQAQLKRLFAIGNEKGWSASHIDDFAKGKLKLESLKDLSFDRYNSFVEYIEKNPKHEAPTDYSQSAPTEFTLNFDDALLEEFQGKSLKEIDNENLELILDYLMKNEKNEAIGIAKIAKAVFKIKKEISARKASK